MENRILIGIGSNVPSRAEEVSRAMLWLRRYMSTSNETMPYPTAPDGEPASTPEYLNAVIEGLTPHDIEFLQSKFKAYERRRGRLPEHRSQGHIIIDIDLVAFNGEILKTEEYESVHFRHGLELLKFPSSPTE